MRNIPTDLDTAGVTRLVRQQVPTTTVSVAPLSEARGYLARDDSVWGWSDLRDYVVGEIERRFGAFPRDPRREAAVFKRFLSQWSFQAPAIARYAFDVCDGWWNGAPISINRFCKGSDPYFADPIAKTLADR